MSMISLVHPLAVTADVRPYLTVLNSDIEAY